MISENTVLKPPCKNAPPNAAIGDVPYCCARMTPAAMRPIAPTREPPARRVVRGNEQIEEQRDQRRQCDDRRRQQRADVGRRVAKRKRRRQRPHPGDGRVRRVRRRVRRRTAARPRRGLMPSSTSPTHERREREPSVPREVVPLGQIGLFGTVHDRPGRAAACRPAAITIGISAISAAHQNPPRTRR